MDTADYNQSQLIISDHTEGQVGNWADYQTKVGNNTKKSGSTIQAQCLSRPCWPPTITIIFKEKGCQLKPRLDIHS